MASNNETTECQRWWVQPPADADRATVAPRPELAGSSVAGTVFISVVVALLVLCLVLWFIGSHYGVIVIQ